MASLSLAEQVSSLKRRLYSRVAVDGECVLFSGALDSGGYGLIGFRGKLLKANRAAWIVHFGEIPAGLCVCHKCDVRNCINPAHLWLGTALDNVRDMVSKGRAVKSKGASHYTRTTPGLKRGVNNGRAKLTERDVLLIRETAKWITQHEAADMFGIGKSMVSFVIRRECWRHV